MPGWPYTTSRWRKLRLAKLARDPLCAFCTLSGRLTGASVVDHNVPISAGGSPFPALDGLTALCPECHNTKTAGHDRTPTVTGRRFKGVGLDGQPLDPADGWHGGPSQDGDREGLKPSSPLAIDIFAEPGRPGWRF